MRASCRSTLTHSVAYMVVTNDETQPGTGKTVIGRVWLTPTALRLETGSQERADALRQLVEALCGARIRHRAREPPTHHRPR